MTNLGPKPSGIGDVANAFIRLRRDCSWRSRRSPRRLIGRLICAGGVASDAPSSDCFGSTAEVERARIGGQIAPEQPARLEPDSPCPFEARVLHPFRGAAATA